MEGGGGEGSYGAAFGLFNIAWSVGYMLGPAAGGFLAARHGLPTAMIVVSIPLLLLAWRVWDAL
jgi:MFS family permease